MDSKNRWLIIVLPLLMICSSPLNPTLIRKDDSRSSMFSITKGHVLMGHVIHKQRTCDIMACAQLCLSRLKCASFNYENTRNGICELNREGLAGDVVVGKNVLSTKKGHSFSQLIDFSPQVSESEFVFTTLSARGETGPRNTSGYVGTLLEDKVTLDNGIQIWTVPVTGMYVIEVSGASGANGTEIGIDPASWRLGGLGAKIKGTFKLQQGTQLKILVGQEGNRTEGFGDAPGGGGGGSFVTLLNNTPLIIAGGGGGGGSTSGQFEDGDPGQATENGTRCGGTGGSGGQVCNTKTGNIDSGLIAGGGAGIKGNGNGGPNIARTPSSFINGGTGGSCPVSKGGFGGGAFAFDNGGGGGGYSGGGVVGTSSSGVAGGGGSYNNGTNQLNMAGVNKGHGKVIIKLKT